MESGELVCSEFLLPAGRYLTRTYLLHHHHHDATFKSGANRFRLNEYLDVDVQVWVAGAIRNMSVLPLPMFQTATTATPAKAKGLRARQ